MTYSTFDLRWINNYRVLLLVYLDFCNGKNWNAAFFCKRFREFIKNDSKKSNIVWKIFHQTFDESCQNKNQVRKIMAGQKKKLRYSKETPWFPEYYIGWIELRNCGHKTSNI